MSLLVRALLISSVVVLAVGCGRGPSSAQDILKRTVDAMGQVNAYRFEGTLTEQDTQGDNVTTSIVSSLGERGPGASFHSTTTLTTQSSSLSSKWPPSEWIAVGGVVYSKASPGASWTEAAEYFASRTPGTPPVNSLEHIAPTDWSSGKDDQGRDVYLVHGKFTTGFQPDVGLTIDAKTYRVLAITLKSDSPATDAGPVASKITSQFTLSDYGADVEIDAPTQYKPAQYSTYEFAIDGDVPGTLEWQAQQDLHSLGDVRTGVMVSANKLVVRVVGQALPPDQIEAALSAGSLGVKLTFADYIPMAVPTATPSGS